jgi:hypothetical protein
MTDIVARLAVHAWRSDGWTRADCAEAADEIERLREALRRIGVGNSCMMAASNPPMCSRAVAARAALGEERT